MISIAEGSYWQSALFATEKTGINAPVLAKCKCGTKKIVRRRNIETGQSKSCGCKNAAPDHIEGRYKKNMLRLLRRNVNRRGNRIVDLWLCDCGRKKEIPRVNVRSGTVKSCGCLRGKSGYEPGKYKKGFLTLIEKDVDAKLTATRVEYYDRFRCDCGNEKVIRRLSVTTGHTKSCGCSKVSVARQSVKHRTMKDWLCRIINDDGKVSYSAVRRMADDLRIKGPMRRRITGGFDLVRKNSVSDDYFYPGENTKYAMQVFQQNRV